MFPLLVAVLSLSLSLVSAANVLVVIEDSFNQADYARFWAAVQSQGHELSFRAAKDSSPQLYEHDTLSFDHLIFFAPTTKSFAEDLSPQRLVQFLEDGGNILVGGSTNLSEFWRDFGREFDLDFDHKSTAVLDHFSHQLKNPSTILSSLTSTPLTEDRIIVPETTRKNGKHVLFRGIGHSVGKNPLLISVLRASPSSYSTEPSLKEALESEPFITGEEIGLITGFQTRKQSRIVFVGSVEFFSDAFSVDQVDLADGKTVKPANAKVSDDITAWVFKQSGVLRIVSSTHSKPGGEAKPRRYRVDDQIEYKVDIQALKDGKWGPYEVQDMQLEFTMLDPHLRLTLNPKTSSQGNSTTYSTVFRAPDRHGVFTFRLDYRRRTGISHLNDILQVMVTPPEHDQHPRFILDAYPYYLGTFNVAVGFVLFCVVWLAHVPGGGKKTQ